MPTARLTKRFIDGLRPGPKTFIAYDDVLAGFGCRVTPSGARSWIVEYRPGGGGRRVAKRRMTLGSATTLTPDAARRAAQGVLAQVRLGTDVAQQRAERREAATVSELATQFMNEEVRPTRKTGTVVLYDGYFRTHVLPALGTRCAREVTHSEVAKLHRSIGKQAPVTANRVLMLISGLYSWGAKAGEIPAGTNPAKGVTRFREEGRERYLTGEELGRLGDALREAETVGLRFDIDLTKETSKHAPKPENRLVLISPIVTAAIRLLLFTGSRVGEILNLRWQDVDFDRSMLFLPDSKTGRKPVILSAPALSVLSRVPRAGVYVIAGQTADAPRHDLKRPWKAIARRAGIAGVRLHDLRHSFAATGAGSGFGLPIIGKLLGHRNVETTSRYAHVDIDPQKVAADRIAQQLATAMGEGPGSSAPVVALSDRRRH